MGKRERGRRRKAGERDSESQEYQLQIRDEAGTDGSEKEREIYM